MAKKRCCLSCGKPISRKNRSGYCRECQQEQEEALSKFADVEMYGDDADYHDAADLEFGNK